MRNWNDETHVLSPVSTKTSKKSSKGSMQASTTSTSPTQCSTTTPIASSVVLTPHDSHVDTEKKTPNNGASSDNIATENSPTIHVPFDQAATRKLLRKLDLHLIPWFALITLLCFLDRTNVGNARLFGLEKDLKMKGLDYNIAIAILFPFYVAAEIPSNMILKRFRPSYWFTIIMLSWGLVTTCMGLVHNFGGLLACRVVLGLAEGGLFPGISFYITTWYCRHECGSRIALFFSTATIAGAFGGILAYGITKMSGAGNKSGWAWVFILEGLLTVAVGSCSLLVINDYPATAKFLTESERTEVQRRQLEDCSALSNDFKLKYLVDALKDWKIWMHMVMSVGVFTPLYSFAFFLPTIVENLGYTAEMAQLMTVPPYVVACFFTILGSYAADKAGQRGVFILGFQVAALAGFLLLVLSQNPHIQYVGTFLAASGVYPLVPLAGAWTSNNIGGSMKRGVGIAMQVGFGNLGGVISGFVYLSKDAPRFVQGHCILIGIITMSFCVTLFMTIYYRLENTRRDALNAAHLSDDQISFERERGDLAVFWRYTI